MNSIRLNFKTSGESAFGTLQYCIVHRRCLKHIPTPYEILRSEWDARARNIRFDTSPARVRHLEEIRQNTVRDMVRLKKIARRLADSGLDYGPDDIAREFQKYCARYSLAAFTGRLIRQFEEKGKARTAETYRAALHSFMLFRAHRDIRLDCLTADEILRYEAWTRRRGLCPNTSSFYLRILRAVYNRAARENAVDDENIFRNVYTGIAVTEKRALSCDTIRQIKSLDLSTQPALDYARDMFMMSFLLRGMSFVDMAYLRKSDLSAGRLIYRRQKTGRLLFLEWTEEMRTIVAKYPLNDSPYLLPIITADTSDARAVYKRRGNAILYSLKKIARRLGLQRPLTLYVARHSWASLARAKGVPIAIISQCLGHESEKTTRIYLANIDTTAQDQANAMVISSIE